MKTTHLVAQGRVVFQFTISIFILSGTLTVCTTLATVSWQAIKAAPSNPIDALGHE